MSTRLLILAALTALAVPLSRGETEPKIPRFSIEYMDPSVKPGQDFYRFTDGAWVKNNPVPADKSRWASFSELAERNWFLIHQILDEAAATAAGAGTTPGAVRAKVGDFFVSAMGTNLIEQRAFEPIAADMQRIERISSRSDLFEVLAALHRSGMSGLFNPGVSPDAKNSSIYAFELNQGGLSLPDRDYYLKDSFASQREAYRAHVGKMFVLLGEKQEEATQHAATVLELETSLAKASRSRVDLRDPDKNYNKVQTSELLAKYPDVGWATYFRAYGLATVPSPVQSGSAASRKDLVDVPYEIVGQPEFFQAMNQLFQERPLVDWKVYLRWHVLRSSAPYLHRAVEEENFAFFGKLLTGQEQQEPRWKRAAKVIDRSIGEALGQLYVEKHFPAQAKARMIELVANLKAVFRDRLQKLDWMTESTRAKALAKFERFTEKIGHPDKFRDYSSVEVFRTDYYGNVRRAAAFEVNRETVRIGQAVDKTEWHMTPETVNAYFNPLQNEIVFPAGILQPPFFDLSMDDAVNYGGIGAVIGHEITHGYDDEGRKFDADGNLQVWWTDADAKAFDARAQKVVDEYNAFEALPGLHVNGQLTLGENIADLGGVTIGYEALQRALASDPSKRRMIDGFTPEQRFFISFAQIWRTNIREAEQRRLVTVDPHSPGRFRAVGPLMNVQPFYDAFGIQAGEPMWRAPELRAKIW